MEEYALKIINENKKMFTTEDLEIIYKNINIVVNIFDLATVNAVNKIKGRST